MSDHNPIITHFKIDWCRKVKKTKVEMYNLKNKDCQKKFKDLTSQTGILSSAFKSGDDLDACTRQYIKNLNQCIRKCFKKIRISDRPNKEIEELFNQRRLLRNKNDETSIKELEDVERKLAEKCAKDNYHKIMEEVNNIDCEEGGVHSLEA